MGFWDCPVCGTKGIMGLPFCPQCRAPSTEEVPAEAPAAPELEPESGTQADASAGAAPESQAQDNSKVKKGGSNAKGE
jgi:hypothetical protein